MQVGASTASSDFWVGLRDQVTGLALDIARTRLVDTERRGDDRYLPDSVDLANARPNVGGMSVGSVLLIVGAVVVGGLLLKRVL